MADISIQQLLHKLCTPLQTSYDFLRTKIKSAWHILMCTINTKLHQNSSSSFRDKTCGWMGKTSTLSVHFMHLTQSNICLLRSLGNCVDYDATCPKEMNKYKWCSYQSYLSRSIFLAYHFLYNRILCYRTVRKWDTFRRVVFNNVTFKIYWNAQKYMNHYIFQILL